MTKNKKIVIGVVVALLLVAGGYGYYYEKQEQKQKRAQEIAPYMNSKIPVNNNSVIPVLP